MRCDRSNWWWFAGRSCGTSTVPLKTAMFATHTVGLLATNPHSLVTPESDQSRRTYGVTGRPIRATSVFRIGPRAVGRDGVVVEKWMLLNARTNTATLVTTRNGRAGWRFNPAANTYAPDFSMCLRTLKGCHPVAIKECPVAAPDAHFTALPS
jgi:hypothetical protein